MYQQLSANCRAAIDYALYLKLPVFPVLLVDGKKKPAFSNPFGRASRDPNVIAGWYAPRPDAQIGTPTGRDTGIVVLDVDVKNGLNAWDSLEKLGVLPLAGTPTAHTPSGGTHLYYAAPDFEVRCSAGKLGTGLDIRGDGGFIVLPAPVGGYRWDEQCSPDTLPLAPMPDWLTVWVKQHQAPPPMPVIDRPAVPPGHMSAYAAACLDGAARDIMSAPCGSQEATLNSKSFKIGQLVGAGEVPEDFAREVLYYAACRMPSHDPARPWREGVIARKIAAGMAAGMRRPRTGTASRRVA